MQPVHLHYRLSRCTASAYARRNENASHGHTLIHQASNNIKDYIFKAAEHLLSYLDVEAKIVIGICLPNMSGLVKGYGHNGRVL